MFSNLLVHTVLLCNTATAVFLIEPGPGRILSPAGTQLQLNCSVIEGFEVLRWNIRLPDLPENSAPVETVANTKAGLRERGITFQNVGTRLSQLIFNGDQRNSHSVVTCRARASADAFNQTDSNPAEVIIYGAPSIPFNLTATENGLGSLNITWSFAFIEGVIVDFILTAMNLNASSAEQTVRTQDQHYIFTTGDHTSCDSYSFSVVAENTLGSSNSSEVVTASVPSLPPSPVVEHSLSKMDDVFMLSLTLSNEAVCPDYPATYTVVLEDSNGIRTIQTSLEFSLAEDLRYTYRVTATNQFGNSTESAPTKITTTDVQSVTIYSMEHSTYSIQCNYVSGSDARGCVYTIVSDGVMGNVTGRISRGDSSDNSSTATVDLASITCYSIVLVYDWESDGTVGTFPIIDITISGIMMCTTPSIAATTPTVGVSFSDDPGLSTNVVIAVSVLLLCMILVVP